MLQGDRRNKTVIYDLVTTAGPAGFNIKFEKNILVLSRATLIDGSGNKLIDSCCESGLCKVVSECESLQPVARRCLTRCQPVIIFNNYLL